MSVRSLNKYDNVERIYVIELIKTKWSTKLKHWKGFSNSLQTWLMSVIYNSSNREINSIQYYQNQIFKKNICIYVMYADFNMGYFHKNILIIASSEWKKKCLRVVEAENQMKIKGTEQILHHFIVYWTI